MTTQIAIYETFHYWIHHSLYCRSYKRKSISMISDQHNSFPQKIQDMFLNELLQHVHEGSSDCFSVPDTAQISAI